MTDYNDMSTTDLTKTLKSVAEQITENNAVAKELSAEKTKLSEIMIKRMEDAETNVIENEFGTFSMSLTDKPHVKDWDAVHKYVRDNNAFYLMYKQLSAKAYNELLDAGETIPGVDKFTRKSVGVSKPKAKYSK